jgi:hypothetical protein
MAAFIGTGGGLLIFRGNLVIIKHTTLNSKHRVETMRSNGQRISRTFPILLIPQPQSQDHLTHNPDHTLKNSL